MKETNLQNKGLVTAEMFIDAMDKIDRRFTEINDRFISIDGRFTVMEEGIDAKFTLIGKRFNYLEQKMMDGFEALDRKIDLVESNLLTTIADREEAFA